VRQPADRDGGAALSGRDLPLPGLPQASWCFVLRSCGVPQDAVTVEGETAEYAGRHFCPSCGSSVFSRLADELEVHLGALDAPDQLTPTYECWTVRREGWLPPFPLIRRYQHDRDDSSRFE